MGKKVKDFQRVERQKEVNDKYRKNWQNIFKKNKENNKNKIVKDTII